MACFIGITGTDGAGKGTVVEFLVTQKGFKVYSARARFEKELEARGLPQDRAHLRLMGNELRARFGDDYFIASSIKHAREAGIERAVFDSVRALAEAERLKKEGGILFAVDAEQHIRFERIRARASESDKTDFASFVRQEALEMNDTDPHGMQKAQVIAHADFTFLNNGTREELFAQVENALANV